MPDDRSFAGGVKVGANYQVQSLVLGLEADVTQTGLESRYFFSNPGVSDNTLLAQVDGLASLRVRVGWTSGPAHLYASGGGAYGMTSLKSIISDSMSTDVYKEKTTVLGFVYGGGVEWRLDDRFSMNVEALQYRLEPSFILDGDRGQLDLDLTTVRAGLTYHFR